MGRPLCLGTGGEVRGRASWLPCAVVGSACLFVSGCFQGKGEAGLQIRGCRYGTHKHLISDVEWLILSTAVFFFFSF